MRVLIDAQPLTGSVASGMTGVGRWTEGAIKALMQEAPGWELNLFAFGKKDVLFPAPLRRFSAVSYRAYRLGMLLRIVPKAERVFGSMDVSLGSAYIPWAARQAAELPVVYDLTHLVYPESMSAPNREFLRRALPRAISRAAMVITTSETVKQEIQAAYGVESLRLAVVPAGVDLDLFTRGGSPPVGIPSEYILYVGTLEPRKNLLRLLEAYRILKNDRPDAPVLVLAGGIGWKAKDARDAFRHSRDVILTGFVDDQSLRNLYANATLLAYPSLYEGFGLPVLEALAAGCPVVASNLGVVREVAAEAAVYFNPRNPEAMASAMRSVLEDETLRQSLTSRGHERAGGYSWQQTGLALRAAVEQATLRKVGG